jgi:hypothetical protein
MCATGAFVNIYKASIIINLILHQVIHIAFSWQSGGLSMFIKGHVFISTCDNGDYWWSQM